MTGILNSAGKFWYQAIALTGTPDLYLLWLPLPVCCSRPMAHELKGRRSQGRPFNFPVSVFPLLLSPMRCHDRLLKLRVSCAMVVCP